MAINKGVQSGFKISGIKEIKKILEEIMKNFRTTQLGVAKGKGLLRLIQSKEGIQQIIQGITEGFSPF